MLKLFSVLIAMPLPHSARLPAELPDQLQRMDRFWHSYRHDPLIAAEVVVDAGDRRLGELDCDVMICGGTLGILLGTALQLKGWRVTILERGLLQGRVQEWNVSRRELEVLLELDLLTEAELAEAIATEYNPARVGFHGGVELWVKDILNIGVDPVFLLATLKQRFLAAGGRLLEQTGFERAELCADGVVLYCGDRQVSGRLLLDMMGHFSPIARQARQITQGSLRPEGVCMVVGSCARGLPEQPFGDLIYTFQPIQNHCQYFWEAFPARDGRTTYMFTYADADPQRPNFSEMLADYLELLPEYQGVDLAELDFQRVLMGFFPAYQQSPLQTPWSRILQVGDSSGLQSPLSFGGFGAMLRHLQRLTVGLNEALGGDFLDKESLRSLQPYQPNLSVTWLFQKSMSVKIGQEIESDRINHLLSVTFKAMEQLGDPVLKPFLQDVVQFPALSRTMLAMAGADPVLVAKIVGQVGLPTLADWWVHYVNLGGYGLLHRLAPVLRSLNINDSAASRYRSHCRQQAWYYGSGADFEAHETNNILC
jgi:lycopene cyclase CruP